MRYFLHPRRMVAGLVGLTLAYCYDSHVSGVWSLPVAVFLCLLYGLVAFSIFQRARQDSVKTQSNKRDDDTMA
jgi:hypothetical protein